jgi:hypothetical protein
MRRKCVDELKNYPYRRKDPWPIPGDVEKHFQMIMGTRLELGWEVPSVRVVIDEEGILLTIICICVCDAFLAKSVNDH